jgi:DNA-binding transcriptional MerR regulator
MFKISEFARISRVSSKTLRHYDEIGLLKPAYVDPINDYRYYTADQLSHLNRIVVLKELGFSLDQVAQLLDAKLSVEQMQGMLLLRQAEIEQHIGREQARLAAIAARLHQIESAGQLPTYEIVLQTVPAIPVASLCAVVDNEALVLDLLEEVEWHVARHKARAAHPPLLLYHDCADDEMEIEVAVPLSMPFQARGRIQIDELPAVSSMACTVYTSDDTTGCGAWEAVAQWVRLHNYRVAGPTREICLRLHAPKPRALPATFCTSEPHDWVTELQFPIERKS